MAEEAGTGFPVLDFEDSGTALDYAVARQQAGVVEDIIRYSFQVRYEDSIYDLRPGGGAYAVAKVSLCSTLLLFLVYAFPLFFLFWSGLRQLIIYIYIYMYVCMYVCSRLCFAFLISLLVCVCACIYVSYLGIVFDLRSHAKHGCICFGKLIHQYSVPHYGKRWVSSQKSTSLSCHEVSRITPDIIW